MECVFCKIANKQVPSQITYEDEHVFAIMDIAPRAPGHTLVVPKFHAPTLLDLPDTEVAPLFLAVKNVAAKLNAELNPDGFTMGINHGEAAGQTVEHLHIHIIPRSRTDGGGSIHSVLKG